MIGNTMLREISHLTPRYIYDRVRLQIERRHNRYTPMIDGTVMQLLDDLIRPDHRGLETGSGGSTVWFAERCAHLISIEHDPAWAQRVRTWIGERGLSDRVELRLCETTSRGTPTSYVGTIKAQEDGSLDFVLVDGKRRAACALAALDKLKPCGLLIIDNVNRYIPSLKPSRTPYSRKPADGLPSPKWESFVEATRQWRCVRRNNGVYETAVWFKPCC